MAKNKISWMPAEEKALNLIVENKKLFLQKCAKELDTNLTITASTTGWQAQLTMKYLMNNPNILMLCLTIGRVLHKDILYYASMWPSSDGKDTASFIDKVTTRFSTLIYKKYERYKDLKKLKEPKATDKLKELLRRGFISYEDVDYLEPNKWVVRHPILRLIHPQDYDTKQEAQEFLNKWGIKGTNIAYITQQTKI